VHSGAGDLMIFWHSAAPVALLARHLLRYSGTDVMHRAQPAWAMAFSGFLIFFFNLLFLINTDIRSISTPKTEDKNFTCSAMLRS
jgi:hypothetical protein